LFLAQPLPARHAGFQALASASSLVEPVTALEVHEVVLTVSSDPPGAEVFEGSEKLGITPFVKRSTKGAPSIELTFRKEGRKDVLRSFDFDRDSAFVVKLPPLHVPKPPPLSRPGKPTKAPKKAGDPYDFEPGRVKSTKDSPY